MKEARENDAEKKQTADENIHQEENGKTQDSNKQDGKKDKNVQIKASQKKRIY